LDEVDRMLDMGFQDSVEEILAASYTTGSILNYHTKSCLSVGKRVKVDFQSSHEAPRSSLRVMHEHFHPITMLNSSF
jgi:hypothetical protein